MIKLSTQIIEEKYWMLQKENTKNPKGTSHWVREEIKEAVIR